MKYRELKAKLDAFTDHQLDQPVVVFENDEEVGKEIDFLHEQEEDIYWYEGDVVGPLDQAKEFVADEKDEDLRIEDLMVIKKGQPTLHINDSL
jgi:hypothetical protein